MGEVGWNGGRRGEGVGGCDAVFDVRTGCCSRSGSLTRTGTPAVTPAAPGLRLKDDGAHGSTRALTCIASVERHLLPFPVFSCSFAVSKATYDSTRPNRSPPIDTIVSRADRIAPVRGFTMAASPCDQACCGGTAKDPMGCSLVEGTEPHLLLMDAQWTFHALNSTSNSHRTALSSHWSSKHTQRLPGTSREARFQCAPPLDW